jgi:RNA polymerase sigma factor (TIGR02999 family)
MQCVESASAGNEPEDTDQPEPAGQVDVSAVFPELYTELKRLARIRLSEGGRNVLLDTTVLVHESYLKLKGVDNIVLRDKEHFLAYAATTMRSVIIDLVRRRKSNKRGGEYEHITLDTAAGESLGATDDEIIEVNNALEALGKVDPRLVRVVEMHYFAGLSYDEIGKSLNVTSRTVARDWERARILLAGMLGR